MQEEVENRTVTLVISATKLTGRVLKAAVAKFLAHQKAKIAEKKRAGPVKPTGKQTVKQLVGQNQGVANYQGLEALHLPTKCYNPLSRNDVKTVREVLIFLCSSARIRNFGALSRTALREQLVRESLLPAGVALPCCNAETPRLDLEAEVFQALNTHS